LSEAKRRKLNHPGAVWSHWRHNQPADCGKPAHRLHVDGNAGGGNRCNGGARPVCFSQDMIRRAADALRANPTRDLYRLANAVLVAALPTRDDVLQLLEDAPCAPTKPATEAVVHGAIF
jgi:hypothetical protein